MGDGAQRWPMVHVRDAAEAYRLTLERGAAGARYHAIAEEGVAVREIAAVIARKLGIPLVAQSPEEAATQFGVLAPFVSADRPTTSVRTREELGWSPRQRGVLEDLEAGNYFTGSAWYAGSKGLNSGRWSERAVGARSLVTRSLIASAKERAASSARRIDRLFCLVMRPHSWSEPIADHVEDKNVTVSWDAPSHAVLFQIHGFVEGEGLRVPSNKIIELLISKRSSRLITDSREMKAMMQEDQRWIDEDWRPRAWAAGLRRNAILLPKSAVAKLSVTAIVRKLDELHFGYFSDLDEARSWLKQP